ncbi:MAG: PAS domain S-box protein [Actinomycetota bacterium]|nr:PAS domain S-box protein [Actinomycetota bacterium]
MRPQDLGIGKLFENVRDAVIVAEAGSGRIVLWNWAATEVFGYSPEEALGLSVEELVPDRLKGRHREGLSRYCDTGHGPYIDSYTVLDLPAVRKGGEELNIELTLSPIEPLPEADAEGRFVLAVVRDVTERKRAEEALRNSEAELRALLAAMTDVIMVLDSEGRYLEIAPTNPSLLYRPPEEIIGRTLHEIFPREQANLFVGGIRKALKTRRTVAVEYSLDIEGREVWFDGTVSPMQEDSVLFVARDVTERKRAEGEIRKLNAELENRVAERTARLESALAQLRERERGLRESKERYQAVVEQAGEGIFLFEPRTKRILEANLAFREMFGYAPEEVTRITLYDLVPQDAEGVDRNVERVLELGRIWIGEREYRRKDGSRIDVEVSGSAISYSGKQVVCSVVRDITERKRAEEDLREAREAERRRIARDMHDRVLSDLVYALQDIQIKQALSGQDCGLEDAAEAMRRSVEGLRAAIFELRLEETLERSIASSLESLAEVNRRMFRGRCNVELLLGEGTTEAIPETTGEELVRIVQEALNNARRHSGASNIRVSLRVEDGRVLAEVSDDGRGFDPRSSMGGVGMSSMRERAQSLGGELEVESEPGKGTTVRFKGPLLS